MNRLLSASVALLGAFALIGGTTPASAEDVVKIGTDNESYPPFTQVDPSGKVVGFEVDLIDAMCAHIKVKCVWTLQAWDGIIPALQQKKFDMIVSSMSITEERKKTIDFSDKYYHTPAEYAGPKAAKYTYAVGPDGALTAESLKGKIVGVQVSTIHSDYLEKKFKGVAEVKTFDTLQNGVLDLIAGRIDLFLADSTALDGGLFETPDGKDFEVKGKPFNDPLFGTGVGLGFRKTDKALREKFNGAIKMILADGTYKKINDKYFKFNIYGE